MIPGLCPLIQLGHCLVVSIVRTKELYIGYAVEYFRISVNAIMLSNRPDCTMDRRPSGPKTSANESHMSVNSSNINLFSFTLAFQTLKIFGKTFEKNVLKHFKRESARLAGKKWLQAVGGRQNFIVFNLLSYMMKKLNQVPIFKSCAIAL